MTSVKAAPPPVARSPAEQSAYHQPSLLPSTKWFDRRMMAFAPAGAPGDPGMPASPLSPLGPCAPAGPSAPLSPFGPAGPESPFSPGAPTGSCPALKSAASRVPFLTLRLVTELLLICVEPTEL